MKYLMRFNGRAFDKLTKTVKFFSKGDVVDAEFEGLLPDTYKIVTDDSPLNKPKPPTTRRKATRKAK